jgi:hypothetical protein
MDKSPGDPTIEDVARGSGHPSRMVLINTLPEFVASVG